MTQIEAAAAVPIEVTTSPHLARRAFTTRRMMFDVLIGLAPALLVALFVFRSAVLWQVITALVVALGTEWVFHRARGKPLSLLDGSAAVTAVILAMSLPPALPLYMTAIGAIVAIGLGKMVFGGLGLNLFNPAMVGRAFLMACFPAAMVTWTAPAVPKAGHIHAITEATPLAAVKFGPRVAPDPAKADARTVDEYHLRQALLAGTIDKQTYSTGQAQPMLDLLTGVRGGCLGETGALALLIGGIWLIARGSASWRVPAGMLGAIGAVSLLGWILSPDRVASPLTHLLSGGAMLGAFFIATDPVSCPLTSSGRWAFGIGVGLLTMLIRLFGGYPEGVMYAVLLMNAVTPLINRATMPKPLGGKANG